MELEYSYDELHDQLEGISYLAELDCTDPDIRARIQDHILTIQEIIRPKDAE